MGSLKQSIMKKEYIRKLWEDFIGDERYKSYFKKKTKCQHRWKIIDEDDLYHYKECEICKRKSKQSRIASNQGYNEPNPQKKKEINQWFSEQKYIEGLAIVLDAIDMKTSNKLLESKQFRARDIIIPEYDTDTYGAQGQNPHFPQCHLDRISIPPSLRRSCGS